MPKMGGKYGYKLNNELRWINDLAALGRHEASATWHEMCSEWNKQSYLFSYPYLAEIPLHKQ